MGSKIEVTKETIEQIKKLYEENGSSRAAIAMQLGISKSVIGRIILEQGFEQVIKEPITYEKLYELYVKKGMTIKEVSSFCKISECKISKKLKDYNIKRRHVGNKPVGITKELLENLYFDKKMKQKEIAEQFNCAVSTISHYFIKYNISTTPSRYDKPKKNYKTRLSKENEKQIIKMCLMGKSKKEIATYFRCSTSTINRKLQVMGLSPKRYTLGDISYDTFYKMCIKENKGIKDIASIYHVSESTVKAQMYRVNFSIKKEQEKIREEKTTKKILEDLYFNKSMTEEDIANYLNIGRKFISRKFKKYGIYKKFKYDCITKEVLEDLYVKQNLAPCYIGEKFNCPPSIIQAKIQKFQLRKYKTEEDIRAYRAKAYEKSLNTQRSKGEKEIEKLFPTPFHNIHSIINLELDLWYPERKVAIEYNGDYWHSIDFPQNSGLHLAKLAICNNKGIQLINIFERDWQASKSKKLLKVHLTRILTPKKLEHVTGNPLNCYIYETKLFENKYNLEGKGNGEKAIGIKNGNNLLSTISYRIESNKCIISRYTTHENYLEDYTPLLLFLKEKEKLPVEIKYDNRYYNKFPCALEPIEVQSIEPELFYVKSRKALRKEEASSEYLNHSKCRAVYDCGYTQVTY